VGISGASGAACGLRVLETLAAEPGAETHLVASSAGALTIRCGLECLSAVQALSGDGELRILTISRPVRGGVHLQEGRPLVLAARELLLPPGQSGS
jgi:3-polyprenyl-4-hydroxybenzoate decarboxylase